MARSKKPDSTKALNKTTNKKIKKADKPVAEKKKPHKKRKETYSIYIFKVMRQIHEDLYISKGCMSIMNSFVQDMFERIANVASSLMKSGGKRTLGEREIKYATKMILPGQLAKHAIMEGIKAMKQYEISVNSVQDKINSQPNRKTIREQTINEELEEEISE